MTCKFSNITECQASVQDMRLLEVHRARLRRTSHRTADFCPKTMKIEEK